ncbi:MAG: PEP-CTERM sorting domain-containing protein [Alphaproteobacteria bacterium]|nr:MAG: PEP-CTERM sorting domain-containing protein [Alphaproteobacteria bacterium]
MTDTGRSARFHFWRFIAHPFGKTDFELPEINPITNSVPPVLHLRARNGTVAAVAFGIITLSALSATAGVIQSRAGGSAFFSNTPGGFIKGENAIGTSTASVDMSGDQYSFSASAMTAIGSNFATAMAEGCDTCTPEIVSTAFGASFFEDSKELNGTGSGSVSAVIKLSGTIEEGGSIGFGFEFDTGDQLNNVTDTSIFFFSDTAGDVNEQFFFNASFSFNFSSPEPVAYKQRLQATSNATATAELVSIAFSGGGDVEDPPPPPAEEEPPPPINLVINWNDPIKKNFEVFTDAATGEQTVIQIDGFEDELTYPPGTTGTGILALQQGVKDKVTEIFAASGVEVNILDSPTPDTLEVRFGPAIIYDENGDGVADDQLGGQAYDVGFGILGAHDRFNVRNDGNVAVFVNFDTDSIETLAERVAHEAGHGLGLRHINPDGPLASAVMDYDQVLGDTERFTDAVSNIVEPPNNPIPAASVGTHNPVYHLRRYGQDISADDLAADSVLPGTWDQGSYSISSFNLEEIVDVGGLFGGSLFNLTAQHTLGVGGFENTVTQLSYTATVDLPGFDGLQFLFNPDAPIRIMASSQPGTEWDLFFGTGTALDPDLLFDDLMDGIVAGSIFQYLKNLGIYQIVGSFSATTAPFASISDTGVVQLASRKVPEPGSMLLFGIGMMAILVLVRRRPMTVANAQAITWAGP